MRLEARGITVTAETRRIVDAASLGVSSGELVGLVGPNGAGKSTLFKAMLGLRRRSDGGVRLDGDDFDALSLRERGRRVAFLPQERQVEWRLPVRDVVMLGRYPHQRAFGRATQDDHDAVARALEAVDGEGLTDRPIAVLSGGERSRILLARALAVESPILLVATEVRLGQRMRRESIGDAYVRSRGSAVDAARFIVESLRTGQDSVVICCRNSARRGINRLARIELGFEEDSICKGEQLVVLLNNKAVGKMNGETIRVDAVSVVCDDEGNDSRLLRVHSDGEVYFVHADSIGAEIGDFKRARAKLAHVRNPEQFLHVDYGYALTPWKAQGSEWDNVCFVLDNWLKWLAGKKPIEAKKIVYTTLTRAKKTVLVLEV